MHIAWCACCTWCIVCICTLRIMCSCRVQKQRLPRGSLTRSGRRSRRDDDSRATARRRASASAEGWNCKRPWRPDHVHPMGIRRCVGGPVAPKHYCSPGGVRIAILAAPGADHGGASRRPIRSLPSRAVKCRSKPMPLAGSFREARESLSRTARKLGAMVTISGWKTRGYFVSERA
jgi:hypothetical protein